MADSMVSQWPTVLRLSPGKANLAVYYLWENTVWDMQPMQLSFVSRVARQCRNLNCRVNIWSISIVRSEGRSEAGDPGGRWRRIVLGHVLAEHVLELRGRARLWP